MNRYEFMKQLEYLLSDIPEEEKRDALNYYRDYLEDAGEAEARVLQEFGSPERIAAIIRSDIQGDLKDGGAFTDAGYRDERFREPNRQVAIRPDSRSSAGSSESGGAAGASGGGQPAGAGNGNENSESRKDSKKGMTFIKAAVIILLVIAALPVLLGIGGGVLGIVGGILGLLVGLVLLAAVLTFVLILAAIAVVFYGLAALFSDLAAGVFSIGIGLILMAFGLLFLVLSVWIYGKFIPWLIRSFVNLVSGILHRK